MFIFGFLYDLAFRPFRGARRWTEAAKLGRKPPGRVVGVAGTALMPKTVLIFTLLAFASSEVSYRTTSIDNSGQLHIVVNTGKEVLAPRLQHQVAFSSVTIFPDHRTVGWFAEADVPGSTYLMSMALVLYRNGRIIHTFATGEVFWDWRIEDNGKQVAYSTGPTHGGATECALVQVASGKVIARWLVSSGTEAPAWAEPLRR